MKDERKTKKQLIDELVELRQRMDEMQGVGSRPSLRTDADELRSILRTMDDLVFVLDQDNCFVFTYSPEGELYLPPDGFFGKTHAEVMPAHIDELFAAALPEVKRGKTAGYEYQLEMPGGPRWYAMKLSALMDGDEYAGLVAVARDITERVQAEEALRESEAYYRLLAENITDLIWMMDMSLRFTYMSPSVTRIGGYSVDEAMALSLAEILTPASFEIAVKVFEEELVAEQTRSREAFWSRVMELEQRHKDGHTIWTEVTISFLRDPDGQPVGILGVTRDITERVQAQEEIQVRLEEFSMLNRFSQSVARTLLKTDEIAMLVAQQFVDVMGLPECSVSLYDPGKGTLKTIVDYYYDEDGEYVDSGWMGKTILLEDYPATAKVMESFEPLVVQASEPDADPAELALMKEYETLTLVVFPLKVKDRIIGILELEAWEKEIQFTHQELDLAMTLANQVAVALDNAQLFETAQREIMDRKQAEVALQQYTRHLEALREASLSLTSNLSLQVVFDALLEYVLQLVPADDAHIFTYDGKALNFGAVRWADGRQAEPFAEPRQNGLTYSVARSGDRMVVNDISDSPIFQDWPLEGAIVGLPLLRDDQVVGVMNVAMHTAYEFGKSELHILELLADQAAVAINNARLYGEVQRHVHQLETLNTVTVALSTSLELDNVLELILDQIGQVLPLDSGAIFLHEEDALPVVVDRGITPSVKGHVFPGENELFKKLQQTGEPLILNNVKDDSRFQNWGQSENIASWMGIPLIARDTLIGFLTLESVQPDAYSPEQAALVRPFAAQAAQAIHNARLYERIIQDSNEIEKRVQQRTEELQNFVNLTAGREIRMAELKKVIKKLRAQLEGAGMTPVADDPLGKPISR